MLVENAILSGNATIVDVRTAEEFSYGAVKNSLNIPIQEIDFRLDEFKNLRQPLVICCASGSRSSLACTILNKQGITALNGGSWIYVNNILKSVVNK